MTTPALEHDFTKPWAQQRVRTYKWCAAITATAAISVVLGVGFGWIPMVPLTGTITCFVFMTPVFVMFATAWIDTPGEKRTTLEKANEFSMLWFCIAGAASELWWELIWLVGDLMGWMHINDHQRWGWVIWYYGINDVRYLNSDGPLWAMELTVVIGAAVLLYSWSKLRKAGNDPDKRIPPLWWTFATMAAMLTVFFIYFVAEARHGFPNFPRHGFWDVAIVLIYENLPWMIAPIVSMPFVAKQLGYLYGKRAQQAAFAESNRRTAQPADAVGAHTN
jgi:uncharacterized membrane protein